MKLKATMDFSSVSNQSGIREFYDEFGIKQYNSFSGGFRYLEKEKQQPIQKQ